LKEACEDNLNVAVGNVNCVIQSVNNEQIVCKPDLSFPGINQDSSDVMVGFFVCQIKLYLVGKMFLYENINDSLYKLNQSV
jgi:hypothetical protein